MSGLSFQISVYFVYIYLIWVIPVLLEISLALVSGYDSIMFQDISK